MSIFDPIKSELEIVNDKLQREYSIRAGHLSSFAHLDLTPFSANIRPALVILSGGVFNRIDRQVLDLATVVQFIYIASTVHNGICEDGESTRYASDPKNGSQFPVLVGDYLYGKFFTTLCRAGIVSFLHPLSQVICLIHEGGILKQKTAGPGSECFSRQGEIVYKETASLFETGCRLAAILAGAQAEDLERITALGSEIGLAYGLAENQTGASHFTRSLQLLDQLPQNKYNQNLKQIIRYMLQQKGESCLA